MAHSPHLVALARYMAGEFDNREQSLADPVWYVHLRLWQRPVPLFQEDSLTFYAEQSSVVNLNQPYRPRIIRLQEQSDPEFPIRVQYYMPKQPGALRGAGAKPEILARLTSDQLDRLPGCVLRVSQRSLDQAESEFEATLIPDARCCFTYEGEIRQVCLGFSARSTEFLSYDKGIDLATGKALWGAIMGPFRFRKLQDFSAELAIS